MKRHHDNADLLQYACGVLSNLAKTGGSRQFATHVSHDAFMVLFFAWWQLRTSGALARPAPSTRSRVPCRRAQAALTCSTVHALLWWTLPPTTVCRSAL